MKKSEEELIKAYKGIKDVSTAIKTLIEIENSNMIDSVKSFRQVSLDGLKEVDDAITLARGATYNFLAVEKYRKKQEAFNEEVARVGQRHKVYEDKVAPLDLFLKDLIVIAEKEGLNLSTVDLSKISGEGQQYVSGLARKAVAGAIEGSGGGYHFPDPDPREPSC